MMNNTMENGGERTRKRVAFFGRFQPFHLGHLEAIRWLLTRFDEVLVLIGMADESHTWLNPFTAEERARMIYEALIDEKMDMARINIAPIPTLRVYTGYSHYIIKMLLPIDVIATTNKSVAMAFRDAGIRVIEPPLVERERYRGENIRRLMAKGLNEWRNYVPSAVARVIDDIDGVARLMKIGLPG